MKRQILAVIVSALFLAGCGDFLDDWGGPTEPWEPSPPSPGANVQVLQFSPTAVRFDSVTTINFSIGWEMDSSFAGYLVLDVVFTRTDSCCWEEPIPIDTLKIAEGQKEFSLDYLFVTPKKYPACRPDVWINIARTEPWGTRFIYSSVQVEFEIIE